MEKAQVYYTVPHKKAYKNYFRNSDVHSGRHLSKLGKNIKQNEPQIKSRLIFLST
jgi:hypothetical protein